MAKTQRIFGKTTLGFRVKSGWASAVIVAGPIKSPVILKSRTVLLSDPNVPETKQPYHAGTGKLEEHTAVVKKRVKIIHQSTRKSIRELLNELRREGQKVRTAALVVGSLTDPMSIGNLHIRAHAFEGQTFRTALAGALGSHGILTVVMLERNIYSEASAILHVAPSQLKKTLLRIGASQKPWSANEKMAALSAWIALAGRSSLK
ncbi:MAG: hypothetical protein HYW57_03230 [Ignavibacteriales bacterium]|nr:hypothetical protein [Ignavibacteriales bacterium]MBI3004204.1 hypothetical protein [Ignavibacteriales bacterium]